MFVFAKPVKDLYSEFLDLTRGGPDMSYQHFERLVLMMRYYNKVDVNKTFNSTFTQDTNSYGDQTIHSRGVYIASQIVPLMIMGDYSFMHILMIIGFIRFLIEVEQAETKQREICYQMGLLRTDKSGISVTTILFNERLSIAQKLIEDNIQYGNLCSMYHLSKSGTEKYGVLIVNTCITLPSIIVKTIEEFDAVSDTHQIGIYDDWSPNKEYYELLTDLFKQAVQDPKRISSLHWHMCIRVPHVRGGGTVAEMLTLGLFQYHSITFNRWLTEPWIQATCSRESAFVANFSSFYE